MAEQLTDIESGIAKIMFDNLQPELLDLLLLMKEKGLTLEEVSKLLAGLMVKNIIIASRGN